MPAGSPGQPPDGSDRQRFTLPKDAIPVGRSQPKRVPPRRDGDANSQLLRRIAWGVATFGVALVSVSLIYGVIVSPDFRSVSIENGTTAAVALLIGCFALPAAQRRALDPRKNLFVCLAVLAITPWTYQLGNSWEDAGMDLATGFNFIFEILLAAGFYRLAARRPATQPA